MKSFRMLPVFLTAILLLISCQSGPQTKKDKPEEETAGERSEIDQVTREPDVAVTIGRLENGFTYYIRENSKPEKTAVLRLVVNVGSVLEEDDEQGLAHFVEHMAFNGTANFEKTDIIDYLESIGIRYGPEVNASTSFDETIYKLEVPTDNEEALLKGFQILSEWAHLVRFEDDEVNRERGIIVEEWRERSGASMRILEKHYPVLFKDSRYAERLPIGKLRVIENAPTKKLLDFYRKWYRPDLMAVIAVGDFKGKKIEEIIKTFSPIPGEMRRPARPKIPVPGHEQTLYSIVTDPETTESRIALYTKLDAEAMKTHGDYRNSIVEYLYSGMLNNRLNELAKKSSPPFISGGTGKGLIVREKEVVILNATVHEGSIERGLEALLVETKRATEFGFTASELEREKKSILRWIEGAYLERENTQSTSYVAEYRRHFLDDETIPGIEYEFELFSTFIPGITLEEVNALANHWLGDQNRVVLVSAPQKSDVKPPDEEDLRLVFDRVGRMVLSAYEDRVLEEPLIAEIPVAGHIVEETVQGDIDLIHWVLSNGAEVFLKTTDFKKDEILFEAMSPGGHSLVQDEKYIATITAPTAIKDSGIGSFSRTELEKKLAGKLVELSPWISEVYEGLSGSASPRDLETLLQLVYLTFMNPRKDRDTFVAYQERLRARFENRLSDPEEVFWDTVRSTLQQNHFRSRPLTVEILDEMDLDLSFEIFSDRFSDAGDFTFILVGSFDVEVIKPLILTYIGGLPSSSRRESWQDLNIDPPGGIVQKSVRMGIEPRSQVTIVFSDGFTWSYETDFHLQAMAEILDTRLREKVREEQSGTYGIWVYATTQKYPDNEYTVYIGFGCDPDRVEELTNTVFEAIEWIRTGVIDEIYLTKEKEILRRSLEKSSKENGYWLNQIALALRRSEDPGVLNRRERLIEQLDADIIRDAARLTLTQDEYIRVVLYPAAWE
jgi:zinc protease